MAARQLAGDRGIPTAIIGTGKVAHAHAQALASLPDSQFVAVYGRDRGRAEAFASRYGVTAYWDLDRMLTSGGVAAATVCTPHPTHPALAVACAEAGVHVLVEKPLAVDLRGADAVIEACRRAGVTASVVSQRRWYPPVRRMKQAIEAGSIGRPALGTAHVLGWRDESYYGLDPWRGRLEGEGGGVLVNQAVHQLDLLLWFMGVPEAVSGFCANINHPFIDVEDTAVASIRFSAGGVGSIVASNSQKPGLYAKVHVHGDNGASVGVQTDGGSMFVAGMATEVTPAYNDLWTVPGEEDRRRVWQAEDRQAMAAVDPSTYYHALQIGDFLRAVRDGHEPAVSLAEGRQVVAMLAAIYRSSAEFRVEAIEGRGPDGAPR